MTGTDSLIAAPARVCKYVLPMPNDEGLTRVSMPRNAKVVSAGIQDPGGMVVWAVEASERDVEWAYDPRDFIVLNTGQWVESSRLEGARFVGTVTASTGVVWHVWEDDQLA